MIKVSPTYCQEQLDNREITIVDVYVDIVTNCVFRFADSIATAEHSGIAVLTLLTAVFEPVGGIVRGGDPLDMRQNFIEGFRYLFQRSLLTVAERAYRFVRCGLFHEGFIKPGIRLKESDVAIAEDDDAITIDPSKVLLDTENQFGTFVDKLKRDAALRLNFEKYWSLRDKNHREQLNTELADCRSGADFHRHQHDCPTWPYRFDFNNGCRMD